MNKRLSPLETKRAIRTLGINKPYASTFGILDQAEDVRYNFHTHRQHQLMFPMEGILFVETARKFFICTPQMGLWIPAGTRHATTTKTKWTLSVFFSPLGFETFSREPTMIQITPLIRESMRYITESPKLGKGYAKELFRVIHGLAFENVIEDFWPTIPVGTTDLLKRTIDVLLQDLSTINVQSLAKQSGQSERSMRRRFADELGIGPEEYIQRVKLIRAMQMLKEEKRKAITEIALDAGYSNHSAFSSAFKKLTGVSPIQFRNDIPVVF